MKKLGICTILFIIIQASIAFGAPVLFFSDLIDGPKTGWEGSATKGAAITVWGENFGTSRGSNYITVAGTDLIQSSDYAEWGITTNNARGLERITFWLNSSCNDGAGTISVTINGTSSNTLDFYVRSGDIYFIDHNNGDNTQDGKKDSNEDEGHGPWQTLAYARQQIKGGDIVYIRTGTYFEPDGAESYHTILWLASNIKGGTNNYTAFVGYPTELPVFDGTTTGTGGVIRNSGNNDDVGYITFSKFKVLPYNGAFRIQNNTIGYFRIIGIEIDGQSAYPPATAAVGAIGPDSISHFYILGNHVHNWGYNKFDHGIYIGTFDGQNTENYDIGWNEFHDLGADVSGIYIHPKDNDTSTPKKYADEINIHDNLCYNLTHAGIHIATRVQNIRIYNNIIYNAGTGASRAPLYFTIGNDVTSNVLLYNNTVYSYGNIGLINIDQYSNVDMKNNIFYSLSGTPYVYNSHHLGTLTSDYDLWYGNGSAPAWATNEVNSDPLFVNASSNDFHIQDTSPAQNAGTSDVSSIVTRDYDGVSRPQETGFDIGAYEYDVGTVDSTAPSAVSNLSVSNVSETIVILAWTAPGNDGDIGTAYSYDIRYYNQQITSGNFNSATQCTGEPSPKSSGSDETFSVTGLTKGQTYYFALKTSDATPNWSGVSNSVSGVPRDSTKPEAVDDLIAVTGADNGKVVLTWTAPGDDGAVGQASQYDIRYATFSIIEAKWSQATQSTGESAPKVAGTTENFTVIGLTPGDTYYFAIKTADEIPNWSDISNSPLTQAFLDSTVPAQVTDLAANPGDTNGQVYLSWSAPGDDGSSGRATQYDIRYSTQQITEQTWAEATQAANLPSPGIVSAQESLTINDLDPELLYYFAIKTADEIPNWSLLSNIASTTPRDSTAPSEVSDLLAASGGSSGEINLSWTSPGDNGNSGRATEYDLRYSTQVITLGNWDNATQVTGLGVPELAGGTEYVTVQNLTPGTSFFFALKTADEVPNWSGISNNSSAAAYEVIGDVTPPSDVTDLLALPGSSTGEIILTWSAPGGDGDSGTASAYDVRYATETITDITWDDATQIADEPDPKVSGARETYILTGLLVGITYYISLKSKDGADNSSGLSNVASSEPFDVQSDTTEPAEIDDLIAASWTFSGTVVIGWTAPGDDSDTGTATEYDIRYSTGSITEANFSSATQYTNESSPQEAGNYEVYLVSNLNAGTKYYFAIKTSDEESNWSSLSNVANAYASNPDITPPYSIRNLLSSMGYNSGEITLTWSAPSDDDFSAVNGYDICYSVFNIAQAKMMINPSYIISWDDATHYNNSLVPSAPGTIERFTLTGLSPATYYYIAIKSIDDNGNYSITSNIVSSYAYSPELDTVAPSAVTDLAASTGSNPGEIILTWTAPGDDSDAGTSSIYDIRYASSLITQTSWDASIPCNNIPVPSIAGTSESFNVEGLSGSSEYYFALKTYDDKPNSSLLSNSVYAKAKKTETLTGIRVFPNPCVIARGYSKVTIANIMEYSEIKIYTINGELLKELHNESTGMVEWDLTNMENMYVASGVYIYVVKNDDAEVQTGNIAIIK